MKLKCFHRLDAHAERRGSLKQINVAMLQREDEHCSDYVANPKHSRTRDVDLHQQKVDMKVRARRNRKPQRNASASISICLQGGGRSFWLLLPAASQSSSGGGGHRPKGVSLTIRPTYCPNASSAVICRKVVVRVKARRSCNRWVCWMREIGVAWQCPNQRGRSQCLGLKAHKSGSVAAREAAAHLPGTMEEGAKHAWLLLCLFFLL